MSRLIFAFSVGNLFIVLTGILIGLLLSLLFVILYIKTSLKKANLESTKEKNKELSNIENIDIVLKKINSIKDQYTEDSKDLNTLDKPKILPGLIYELTEGIAKIYYPESDKPLFELTLKESTILIEYISDKIDRLFDTNNLTRMIRKVHVKPVMDVYKKLMAIKNNTFVKTAAKVYSKSKRILNLINPYYWTRVVLFNVILNVSINEITDIVIDVVGIETAKIYSKNIFKEDINVLTEKEYMNLNNEEDM